MGTPYRMRIRTAIRACTRAFLEHVVNTAVVGRRVLAELDVAGEALVGARDHVHDTKRRGVARAFGRDRADPGITDHQFVAPVAVHVSGCDDLASALPLASGRPEHRVRL